MRHARIGALEVSAIGLGCNNLGRSVDAQATVGLVDAALGAGITFFDTSDNYGEGRSERFLGEALKGRRDEAVIATKFGMHLPWLERSGGASPRWIERAVEQSLRQLQTDHIDLYYLHKPDASTPIESTLEGLYALVDAGKVREIACSNLDVAMLDAAAAAAARAGRPGFSATQMEYSLLRRDPEHDGTLDACARNGMSLLPYYPLASGMLTGKHTPGQETGRLALDRYEGFRTDENHEIVARLRSFVDQRGRSLTEVAIAWLLAQPQVPSVIVGASRPEQVVANAAAGELTLRDDEAQEIANLTRRTAA